MEHWTLEHRTFAEDFYARSDESVRAAQHKVHHRFNIHQNAFLSARGTTLRLVNNNF